MAYYSALVAEWAALSGTTAQKLAANPVPWWSATVAQGGGGLSSPVGAADLSSAGGLV
jgi:hypothetical protein